MREHVCIIRVFVSSPGDVAEERGALDEVVKRINRLDGQERDVRLELWKWEENVVPRIGPEAQSVVDAQMPLVYDIYLGIMKHRFGTPAGGYGSGTEKEFHDALKRWEKAGAPWILFYFRKASIDPTTLDLKQYAKVQKFQKRMEKKGLYATYEQVQGEDGFFRKVDEHLRKILRILFPLVLGSSSPAPADPTAYLRHLLAKTACIDIRGLQVGKEQAHQFPIEDLYISLTTTHAAAETSEERMKSGRKRLDKGREWEYFPGKSGGGGGTMPLHEALRNERLVIVGDPGAGKTTFLRRVAHSLCLTELGEAADAARSLGIAEGTFPILIRLDELDRHISKRVGDKGVPTEEDSPAWLIHYLETTGLEKGWGLDGEFFRRRMEGGLCTVLLDGLDEAPDRIARWRLSRLIENATLNAGYLRSRFVVTTRPVGYAGETVLPGFVTARIDLLSDESVETFLSRWCEALYSKDPEAAGNHCGELLFALGERPDIRRMARNPVMLTALAVVHWNERRLPEQRADLYESIIRWLSRSREQRLGREKAERTVVLLQELALAMQEHSEGMRTEVPVRWAAEQLAGEFATDPGEAGWKAIGRAESFLNDEELDSGIIVGRGGGLRFWHRTFQEFLAARAIAARPEAEQQKIIWGPPSRLYMPEWREVMLLLAGILHQQGRAKVDSLVREMLESVGSPDASLADQARCAGLVGAMLRDLAPVGYNKPSDPGYHELLDRVMAIFDRERSESVPIDIRIEAADALGQTGDHRLDPHNGEYWATIDAGEFRMGSQSGDSKGRNYDPDAYEDESPVHKVRLDAYRIGRYPVTVDQYRKFVEDDGYEDERWWKSGEFGEYSNPDKWEDQLQFPSRPVVYLSWYEATAYCEWAGCRLPTEAQWERAARGTDGRKYPWGNEPADPTRLNYLESRIGHATPVGIYPLGATPERICDMAGNVYEWCADGYGPYSAEEVDNPRGAEEVSYRVIRGGYWGNDAWSCRSALRFRHEPWSRNYFLGFRVAQFPPRK